MLPLWYIIFRYINYITIGIYSEYKLNNIGDLLENLNQSWILYTQSHENIDQILNQIGLIYKASKNLSWLAKYKKGGSSIYRSLAEKEYIFCLSILKILNSDLSIQIEKQQLILESVKSEVEKNLSGTPELLEVSEAQKLRLDRQIEQFKELQKRLVKIS
ncbi:hypothetical protein KBB25_01680 [Candidatus Gracilibacteria bacterium]|nr:hypothetical protein [Candidatus Gracilibacteria bacterium]